MQCSPGFHGGKEWPGSRLQSPLHVCPEGASETFLHYSIFWIHLVFLDSVFLCSSGSFESSTSAVTALRLLLYYYYIHITLLYNKNIIVIMLPSLPKPMNLQRSRTIPYCPILSYNTIYYNNFSPLLPLPIFIDDSQRWKETLFLEAAKCWDLNPSSNPICYSLEQHQLDDYANGGED